MFRENRLWPTFVGAKIQGDKETERGALPVLLWPEQRSYLDECDGINGNNNTTVIKQSNDRKRKRENNIEMNNEESSSSSSSSSSIVQGYVNPSKKIKKASDYVNIFYTFFKNVINNITFGTFNKLFTKKLLNHEEQRYIVFKDLQDRGWFIGPADVYGGDYNIYQDNPSTSHSMATIRVVYNGIVSARDLLAYSRVQNQVAKSAVFAFVNSNTYSLYEPVKYQVINFQAVGDRM